CCHLHGFMVVVSRRRSPDLQHHTQPRPAPSQRSRACSAVVALCAGSSWVINGSLGQAAKLDWIRIWKVNQCAGGISQSAHPATSSASVLRIYDGVSDTAQESHILI
ncbi:hypothetical protein EK21DRAFT_55485, partial [Setomelanomma holmii]